MDDNSQLIRGLDDQEESVRIAVKALGDMRNSGARSDNARTAPSLSISSGSHSSSSSIKSPRLASPTSSSRSRESTALSESSSSSSAPAFVSRMSSLPLLGSAMRVYEQGKASSRVMKYGAEMVESSVKAVSRPVIERLPVNVNQLDDFACRQLDRLDRYRRPSVGAESTAHPSGSTSTSSSSPSSSNYRGRPKLKTKTLDGTAIADDEDTNDYQRSRTSPSPQRYSTRQWKGSDRDVPSWLEASSPFVTPPPPPPADSRSSTPTQNGADSRSERSQSRTTAAGSEQQQVAQRSRWQAVLLEAGGLSAALSEESMRRLKYCLQWLQYATAHIDAQILILRDFTANLQPLPSDNLSTTRRPPISEEHMRKLTDVRRDIVHTIRQVVDVVSKYAGGALPEPARNRVRGFILKLPQRWATKAGPVSAASGIGMAPLGGERDTVAAAAGHGTGAVRRPGGQRRAAHRERGTGAPEQGMRSGPSSRAPSPSSSPRIARAALGGSTHPRHGNGGDAAGGHGSGETVSASAALVASQRILTLATESLDMMRNVTGVVKDSLDRADAWIGRLRTVGIQRGAQEGEDTEDPAVEFELPEHMKHRRTGSAQSLPYDDHDVDSTGMPPSPFFSGSSTSNWGSSIPSTPGGGTYTPGYGFAGNAPSPGAVAMAIPIGAMSLHSKYNTPKSVAASLPEETEDDECADGREAGNVKAAQMVAGDVGVVDVVDREVEDDERGVQKMDVDL